MKEDKHSPIVEYRGEKEVWIWLPDERTEIYIVRGKEIRQITLNETDPRTT